MSLSEIPVNLITPHPRLIRQLWYLVLGTAALLGWFNIVEAQGVFETTDAFVKANLKDEDRLSAEAKGDLNADGLADWVGVIRGQVPDSSPTYELFVLLAQKGGGFKLAEKSQKAEIPGMGCCWMEDLQIRRGSIFVQNNAKTASEMEAATHQFKFYKGEWRLIGLTIYLTDHTPTAPMTKDTEMNLLTGLVIEKTKKGNRKEVTRRRSEKFQMSLLRDFDFSNGFGVDRP